MVKIEKRHYKNFACLVFVRANLKRTLSGGRVCLHNSFCDRLLDERPMYGHHKSTDFPGDSTSKIYHELLKCDSSLFCYWKATIK